MMFRGNMSRVGSLRYLAVSTVDESSFGQQVAQQVRQLPGQRRDVQDLSHPTRHVHHGLVGEAHVQGSVASFQPAGNRFQDENKQIIAANVSCEGRNMHK